MCALCDGKSWDEVFADMAVLIVRYGWMLQGVAGTRPWTYTIGLAESFNHPELLLLGSLSTAGRVLNEVGERIRVGARISDGDRIVALGHEYDVRAMHPDHIDRGDVVGMWQNYYDNRTERPPLAVLQLTPLDDGHGVRLDRANTSLRLHGGRHRRAAPQPRPRIWL